MIPFTFVFGALILFGPLISSPIRLAVGYIFSVVFESDLKCTPKHPDHRRSQGHLGIPLDRRNPSLYASARSFVGFSHYVIDSDEEKQL